MVLEALADGIEMVQSLFEMEIGEVVRPLSAQHLGLLPLARYWPA
jgi:hypothetical protein